MLEYSKYGLGLIRSIDGEVCPKLPKQLLVATSPLR